MSPRRMTGSSGGTKKFFGVWKMSFRGMAGPRDKHGVTKYIVLSLVFLLIFLAIPPKLMEDVSFSRAVYDRHGTLLRLTLAKDDTYRLFVPLKEISPLLIESALLHEDKHFYSHPGINPASLARAAWHHVAGGGRGGASTLTMQLVRLKTRMHTKSYAGKAWQMLQALRMELHYSKDEILEAYLNLAPYGSNIEGAGAASRIYFGRDANMLSLPEALTLAAVPQSPHARTPGRSKKTDEALMTARLREFAVWKELHPEDAKYQPLLERPMRYGSKKDLPFISPQWVSRMLAERSSEKIITSLDADLQAQLAGQVQRYVAHNSEMGMANAAALLVDTRDMSVVASVGSADYFNLKRQGMVDGTRARRSPGSALKPFIYALAFEQGIIHPASLMIDAPTAYSTYAPENFDRAFQGPLSAREALNRSRNIPALWLTGRLKKPDFYNFLKDFGIARMKPEATYGLSLALGGVEVTMEELVELYAMLANDGMYNPLKFSLTEPSPPGERRMSAEAAFMALDILKDTPTPGGSAVSDTLPLPVYWKTGTSGGLRDAWSVGVFGPYVLAVWVGDFRGTSRGSYVGITHAAPLFFDLMRLVVSKTKPNDMLQAKASQLKLTKARACADTGDIDSPYCSAKVPVWLIPGVSPIKSTGIYRNVLVNRNTGQLACAFEPGVTDYRVVQFWPSEITQIFADAGIHKPAAPEWSKGCAAPATAASYVKPRITSPANGTGFRLRKEGDNKLALKAAVDGNVHALFWFMDNNPVARANPGETVFVELTQGRHTLRVVDDRGKADSRVLMVE